MTVLEAPICRIIAGPNGAGKTTFALAYLRQFPDDQLSSTLI
jgi:ABC-type Mn2+/Zn2+ transport system ATPase subunit